MANKPGENDPDHDTDVEVEDESVDSVSVCPPRKHAVILHNDDYTTMECVIEILQRIFSKTKEEATGIMLKVHHDGKGVAGIYTFEIAETKAKQAMDYARANGFPLKCSTEPVEGTD